MSEQKMGTHYVREIVAMMNEIAEKTSIATLKDKLSAQAAELAPLDTKLFFKTQKGTEDMEAVSKELANLKSGLISCSDPAEADKMLASITDTLEKTIKHVKTMKVRMT